MRLCRLHVAARRAGALALAALIVVGAAAWAPALRSQHASATATQLRVWYATDDPDEGALAQALAKGFGASHPSIHVALQTFGLDDLNQKMQLALAGGTPSDVVYTTPRGPGLPAYVRAGKLRDLTSAARQNHWAARLRPGLLADYNSLLTHGTRGSGHIYAAPYALAAVGVLYNKALFQRLRLSVPRTLAQMETLLGRIQRTGFTPLGLGNADGWVGDDWYLTMVNALTGPAALTPALRLDPHFSFGGSAFHTAASTLQSWSERNYFTRDFGGLDAQDSVDAFFEGRTAMQLVSSTEDPQILTLTRESKLDVGVFPFPSATAGRPGVVPQSGYAGWAIPTAARQPAAALTFINAMTTDTTARALAAYGLLPASRVSVATLHPVASFQRDYLEMLTTATPGVYLDAAPVPNLNATMEANVQLLLQRVESPSFISHSLQEVYNSYGVKASSTRTDGEF